MQHYIDFCKKRSKAVPSVVRTFHPIDIRRLRVEHEELPSHNNGNLPRIIGWLDFWTPIWYSLYIIYSLVSEMTVPNLDPVTNNSTTNGKIWYLYNYHEVALSERKFKGSTVQKILSTNHQRRCRPRRWRCTPLRRLARNRRAESSPRSGYSGSKSNYLHLKSNANRLALSCVILSCGQWPFHAAKKKPFWSNSVNIISLPQFTIERNTCGPDDITIDIKYCGICHTDVHFVNDDMGMPVPFPLVPGHEIAGVVTQVSSRCHAT